MVPYGYTIRLATSTDIEKLPEIERIARLQFRNHPEDLGISNEIYDQPGGVDGFVRAKNSGRLWVAAGEDGELVGFALVSDIEGFAHLDELNVLPLHGRQGVGTALVDTVCGWATRAGYSGVSLRTFRDVAWNGPFYRKLGFVAVASSRLSESHARLEDIEKGKGLRLDARDTMVKWL